MRLLIADCLGKQESTHAHALAPWIAAGLRGLAVVAAAAGDLGLGLVAALVEPLGF